jgi:hypothetical protein
MADASDDLIVRTESGIYKVPANDLERYRVEPSEVEGFAAPGQFNFGLENLRPNSQVTFELGSKPIVQQRGYLLLSGETKCDV